MAYRLGCLCGRWDVETEGGLLDQIPDWQLWRWIEYSEDEPFDNRHKESRSILDTLVIANSVRAVGNSFGAKLKNVELEHLQIVGRSREKESKAKKRTKADEIKQFELEMKMIVKCGKAQPGK